MHAKPMRPNRVDAIMATRLPVRLDNGRLPRLDEQLKAALEINEILD